MNMAAISAGLAVFLYRIATPTMRSAAAPPMTASSASGAAAVIFITSTA
jgi:hypothetical protein